MRKLYFILFIFSIGLQSCTKDFPIIFSKKTDNDTITLQLFKDNSFIYKAKSSKGVAFNEKGTYFINDSLLILDYKHKEYSYNCLTIPLPNDTLLFVRFESKNILIPVNRIDFITNKIYSTERVMNTIVKEYSLPEFHFLIGSKYFELTEGNISKINNNNYLISKYYDTKLQK